MNSSDSLSSFTSRLSTAKQCSDRIHQKVSLLHSLITSLISPPHVITPPSSSSSTDTNNQKQQTINEKDTTSTGAKPTHSTTDGAGVAHSSLSSVSSSSLPSSSSSPVSETSFITPIPIPSTSTLIRSAGVVPVSASPPRAAPPSFSRLKSITQPNNHHSIKHSSDVKFENGRWQSTSMQKKNDEETDQNGSVEDEFDELDAIEDFDTSSSSSSQSSVQAQAEKRAEFLAEQAKEKQRKELMMRTADAISAELDDIDDEFISPEKLQQIRQQKQNSAEKLKKSLTQELNAASHTETKETINDSIMSSTLVLPSSSSSSASPSVDSSSIKPRAEFLNGRWVAVPGSDGSDGDDEDDTLDALDDIEDFDPIRTKQEEEERATQQQQKKQQKHQQLLSVNPLTQSSHHQRMFSTTSSSSSSSAASSPSMRSVSSVRSSRSNSFSRALHPSDLAGLLDDDLLNELPSDTESERGGSSVSQSRVGRASGGGGGGSDEQRTHHQRYSSLSTSSIDQDELIMSSTDKSSTPPQPHHRRIVKSSPNAPTLNIRPHSRISSDTTQEASPALIFANVFHLEPSKESLMKQHPEDNNYVQEEKILRRKTQQQQQQHLSNTQENTLDKDNEEEENEFEMRLNKKLTEERPDSLEELEDFQEKTNSTPPPVKNESTQQPPPLQQQRQSFNTPSSTSSSRNSHLLSPSTIPPRSSIIASPSSRQQRLSFSSSSLPLPTSHRSLPRSRHSSMESSIVNLRHSDYNEADLDEIARYNALENEEDNEEKNKKTERKKLFNSDDLDEFQLELEDDDVVVNEETFKHLSSFSANNSSGMKNKTSAGGHHRSMSTNRSLEILHEFQLSPTTVQSMIESTQENNKEFNEKTQTIQQRIPAMTREEMQDYARLLVEKVLKSIPEAMNLPKKILLSTGLKSEQEIEREEERERREHEEEEENEEEENEDDDDVSNDLIDLDEVGSGDDQPHEQQQKLQSITEKAFPTMKSSNPPLTLGAFNKTEKVTEDELNELDWGEED